MRWAWIFVLAGCGRIGFVEPDAATDASNDACRVWSSFEPPVHIVEVGRSGDDWDPAVTVDGLELYFYSSRPGTIGSFDIFVAHRDAPDRMFSTPVDVGAVSSTAVDHTPFVTEDGLALLFGSDRVITSNMDLYIATRTSRTAAFSPPTAIATLNSGSDDNSPWLSPDGLRLYFTSTRGVNGDQDLYFATRASTADAFGMPTLMTELNSLGNERKITLSHDELEAFVESNRSGNFEIYRTTRTDRSAQFSGLVPVSELSTALDEVGLNLTADGTTLYLNYGAVVTGGSNSEIWRATRTCLTR